MQRVVEYHHITTTALSNQTLTLQNCFKQEQAAPSKQSYPSLIRGDQTSDHLAAMRNYERKREVGIQFPRLLLRRILDYLHDQVNLVISQTKNKVVQSI
jgi:hypothetical protein